MEYSVDLLSKNPINSLMENGEFFITILNGQLIQNLCNLPNGAELTSTGHLNKKHMPKAFKAVHVSRQGNDVLGCLLKFNSSKENDVCVHINHISTKDGVEKVEIHNRFVVCKNANINIIEQAFCLEIDHLGHQKKVTSEWLLEEGASLSYYGFGEVNSQPQSRQTNTISIQQKQNSVCDFFTFYWDSCWVENKINAELLEKNTTCRLHSISLLKKNSCVNNNIIITHHASDCESEQNYKGVYDEESKGVFNGIVVVKRDAQNTNAFQNNNNILLSDYASIQSNPQLEIFADDVKCSHGSTTGQLDQKALFYLRSRGCSEALANNILLQAFLNSVLESVQHPELKKSIILTLNKKLDINQAD